MPKRLDIENGEVVDSTDDNTDDADLPDSRCPICAWTGPDDDVYDHQCPRCGYGLVQFEVRWADTVDDEEPDTDDDVGGLYEHRYGREGSE